MKYRTALIAVTLATACGGALAAEYGDVIASTPVVGQVALPQQYCGDMTQIAPPQQVALVRWPVHWSVASLATALAAAQAHRHPCLHSSMQNHRSPSFSCNASDTARRKPIPRFLRALKEFRIRRPVLAASNTSFFLANITKDPHAVIMAILRRLALRSCAGPARAVANVLRKMVVWRSMCISSARCATRCTLELKRASVDHSGWPAMAQKRVNWPSSPIARIMSPSAVGKS